jgi:hypothetical protein
MRRPWWLLVVLGALIAAAPGAPSDADDLERNRRLLEKWRADPEHYKRLQTDLRAFHALPAERQQKIRDLDRQLHELDLTTQARLWAVLDRYHTWLERLPEAQRQQVKETANPADRLKLIRALREQEWIDRLPAKVRGELAKLPPGEKATEVARLRRQERAQRLFWIQAPQRPSPETRPGRLSEFPSEVQVFVRDLLMPRLNADEKAQLRRAEGKWPELARTIRELSDRHPVLPPLPPPRGPITKYDHLPATAAVSIPRKRFADLQGRWPEYALAVTTVLKKQKRRVAPLGASKLDELPSDARQFVQKQLLPALGPLQKDNLRRMDGRWPEYPKRLLALAWQKRLVIPGMSLPGPRELWDAARAALPEVPGHLLYQFALTELSEEDRAELELSAADPAGSRERLKKAYFKRKRPHRKGQRERMP